MNENCDEIIEKIAACMENGNFDNVETVPGSIYLTKDGKQYVVSVTECECSED